MRYEIDEPCNEDWDAMEPHEDGRFCQSCQHSVVDATQMTKSEFESFYQRANGDVCAQVRSNPAGGSIFRRELVRPKPLGSFVLLSSLLASACASEAPVEPMSVPLVVPGLPVEHKIPSELPLSLQDGGFDANVDAGVDASVDMGVEAAAEPPVEVQPRRHIRRGRMIRRH